MSKKRFCGIAVGALALILCTGNALRGSDIDEPLFPDKMAGDAPGDYGYLHDKYHDFYQKLFGVNNRCPCGDGECRVTVWRKTKLNSPKGYDVAIDRHWYPVADTTWMPSDATPVPLPLFSEWAHICAYPSKVDGHDTYTVSCAMINQKQM